jgi:hypothetical protein
VDERANASMAAALRGIADVTGGVYSLSVRLRERAQVDDLRMAIRAAQRLSCRRRR